MKYIRTNYNTIEDLDKITFDAALTRETFVKYNAFKQADNIEELCDRFITFFTDGRITVHQSINTARVYHKRDKRWQNCANCIEKVYGAIWTDKGLIYVAKMKENGVFELL